ncbi:MAG: methylmalonyl-CoA carboxyltransferase, partial [Deltaproteobacteria bacterium]|nr:methylmalonyl-CoA carboxyltransferase [Deltaproteobacteria bacterium]
LLRKVYGGAALGMGILPGFGTDLIYAWPTAEIGAMGAEQAVGLFFGKEINEAADPESFRREKVAAYRELYADSLALASQVTYIQDIIEPAATRQTLIRSFALLRGKRRRPRQGHHGNIPL